MSNLTKQINEALKSGVIEEKESAIPKKALVNIMKDIEKLRNKYDATSDEALTLAVFRDMTSRLKRGFDVKKLADELEKGFE